MYRIKEVQKQKQNNSYYGISYSYTTKYVAQKRYNFFWSDIYTPFAKKLFTSTTLIIIGILNIIFNFTPLIIQILFIFSPVIFIVINLFIIKTEDLKIIYRFDSISNVKNYIENLKSPKKKRQVKFIYLSEQDERKAKLKKLS